MVADEQPEQGDQTTQVVVVGFAPAVRARVASVLASQSTLRPRFVSSLNEVAEEEAVVICHCSKLAAAELQQLKDAKAQPGERLVIVVCNEAENRAVRRAVDAGVDGLVFIEQLGSALAPTVAAVLAGQLAVPRRFKAFVSKTPLSPRERQLLSLVVMGHTNSEIGARVFLAESTVKSHLSSAYAKLGVRSRSEAVSLMMDPVDSVGVGVLTLARDD